MSKWLSLIVLTVYVLGSVTFAQYPTRAVEFMIPWEAGGSADVEGRVIANEAEQFLGQPLVPVNRPGAGSGVGFAHLREQPADGYTIGWTSTGLLTTTILGNVPFDYTAFDHVARVSIQSMPWAVRADSPWETFEDLVAFAQENPGAVLVGNAGVGSGTHVAAAAIADAARIEVVHVPLGSGERIPALLRGEVQVVSVPLPEVMSQVRAGELRLLVTPSAERDPLIPDVPTMLELGYELSFELHRGISVPLGTPREVIETLAEAFRQAAESEAFRELGEQQGFSVSYLGPEEYTNYLAEQHDLVGEILQRAGLID
ncbi:MAG: tripartite tricarboxylate transporter substrate binding protein [Thermosphaera sp.]